MTISYISYPHDFSLITMNDAIQVGGSLAIPFSWLQADFDEAKTKFNALVDATSVTPAASTIPVSDSSGKLDNGWLLTGSGNGLDADKVDGAHASATPTANYIPIADSSNKIANGWLNTGSGNGLDADTVDGKHASATPTASYIPVADASNKLDNGWLKTGSGNGLDADTIDTYHATTSATANTIPVTDSNGRVPFSRLYAYTTPTAYYMPQANASGKIDNGWLNTSIRGYESPVDSVAYYNSHNNTNYPISVGEVCKITFSNANSVPLRIATSSGQLFDIGIYTTNTGGTSGGGAGHISLKPNDTTYANAFVYVEYQRTTASSSNISETNNYFRVGYDWGSSRFEVFNSTGYKVAKGMYDIYGMANSWPAMCIFDTVWQDTTTSWTSLGTVSFAQNSTGFIMVRRLA